MSAFHHIDRNQSNGLAQIQPLVLSNNTAVAQAIIASLSLRRTQALKLCPPLDAMLSAAPCVKAPQLAIVMESDIDTVVAAIRALKHRWHWIKILVGGLPNQEESILRAFAAGAHGVVLDAEPLDQLAQAVQEVLADRYRPPPQLIRPFFERLFQLESAALGTTRLPPLTRLSGREVEVLNSLAQGQSNKAIAAQVHIEVQTVKNHLSQIFRKLGVHSRFDAGRVAALSTRDPK